MLKSYTFWLKAAIVLQFLTGLIHSLSFFVDRVPSNETEKQLMDLMNNYRTDMGAGFAPSMQDFLIALSSCFTILFLFGGMINIQLLRSKLSPAQMKGFININLVVFGAAFVMMYIFTFLPPVALTGLTLALLIAARATVKEV